MALMGQIAPRPSRLGSVLHASLGTSAKERTNSDPFRFQGRVFQKNGFDHPFVSGTLNAEQRGHWPKGTTPEEPH
jgi:hypothetical protein